jgi:hypothetical protein
MLDGLGQGPEVAAADTDPDDARALGVGKGPEPAEDEVEGIDAGRGGRERLTDLADPAILDVAEESQGHVKVPRPHPRDAADHGAQGRSHRIEALLQVRRKGDGDEGANERYRRGSSA